MQVTDLESRLSLAIDDSAEPVDHDQALARFLLNYVRSTVAGSTSPATVSFTTEVDER